MKKTTNTTKKEIIQYLTISINNSFKRLIQANNDDNDLFKHRYLESYSNLCNLAENIGIMSHEENKKRFEEALKYTYK